MTPEPGIKVVLFLLIAGEAECLQIADIVLTPIGKGNDVINGKISF